MYVEFYYVGSMEVSRFNRELEAVAEVFGGVSSRSGFSFPRGTNKTLVRWFNNIYGSFTVDETEEIWKYISNHEEIEDISSSIWRELKNCVRYEDNWSIR